MDLDKFAVGVFHPLHIEPAVGSAGAEGGIGRLFENQAGPARSENDSIGL